MGVVTVEERVLNVTSADIVRTITVAAFMNTVFPVV